MTDEEAPKKKGEEEEVAGDGPGLKKVLEGLAAYGVTLPDDTSDENFMDRLLTALKALSAAKEGGGELDDEVSGTEQEVPPVAMSMDRRLKATEGRLVAMERADLRRRINTLYATGRISKPIRDKLANQANAVQLSLDADGNTRPNSLSAKVEAYEELDQGAAWAGNARLSLDGGREVAPPARESGQRPQNAQEVQAVVDGWDEAMGRKGK